MGSKTLENENDGPHGMWINHRLLPEAFSEYWQAALPAQANPTPSVASHVVLTSHEMGMEVWEMVGTTTTTTTGTVTEKSYPWR